MTTVELIKKACAALDAAVLVDNNQYSIGRASVFLEFAEAQAKADVADPQRLRRQSNTETGGVLSC